MKPPRNISFIPVLLGFIRLVIMSELVLKPAREVITRMCLTKAFVGCKFEAINVSLLKRIVALQGSVQVDGSRLFSIHISNPQPNFCIRACPAFICCLHLDIIGFSYEELHVK